MTFVLVGCNKGIINAEDSFPTKNRPSSATSTPTPISKLTPTVEVTKTPTRTQTYQKKPTSTLNSTQYDGVEPKPSSTPAGTPIPTPTPTHPKLVTSNRDSGAMFGKSISIADGQALIGAPQDKDPNGVKAGAAYFFSLIDGQWNQEAKLYPKDGDAGDRFGRSVALDGDTALIGAPKDEDPNGEVGGAVYILELKNETWSQRTKLAAQDGDSIDSFGLTVALKENTALVGAPMDEDPNGIRSGATYVFSRNSGKWLQNAKLSPTDGDSSDLFSSALAMDKKIALIGSPGEEGPNGKYSGAVYIFKKINNTWKQQAKLEPSNGKSGDKVGSAVALRDGTAIIGAPGTEHSSGAKAGVAYVFQNSDGVWHQEAKFAPDDGDSHDRFGSVISLNEEVALIGAPHDEDPNGEEAGSSYIFKYTNGSRGQKAKLTPTDGGAHDKFGAEVALDRNTALIGAPGDGERNKFDSGSAYVFSI